MPDTPPPTYNKRLKSQLENKTILLDTCFAMSEGFEEFCRQYLTDPSKYKLFVPTCVDAELQKHQNEKDPTKQDKKAKARTAALIINRLVTDKAAQVVGDRGEEVMLPDTIIKSKVVVLRMSRPIVVLTNDVKLASDLTQIDKQEAERNAHAIKILKLNSKTNKLAEFKINNSLQSNSQNPAPRPRHNFATNPSDSPTPFRSVATIAQRSERVISTKRDLTEGETIYLGGGQKCILGKKLGAGGEGIVYEVLGRKEVCKLYAKHRLTEETRDKVLLLMSRKVSYPGICWPIEAVNDSDGTFRGFLMQRAEGTPLGQSLFLPKPFLQKHPNWTRLESTRLATTILKQIQYLHDLGVTLGDINPQNFLLVDEWRVFLVDCDSFQVEEFPCPVGTVNFTPPELQGIDFKTVLRTKEHEMFAVATLIFMIFLPGNCPYTHTGGTDGAANIKKGEFAYATEWKKGGPTVPMGVWRYCWAHLSGPLKYLFRETFHHESKGPQRPDIRRWLSALSNYEKILTDPKNVFLGPKPVSWGYDLSIMPQSVKYDPDGKKNNFLPADGRTGYERIQEEAVRELLRQSKTPWTPAPSPPTSRSTAHGIPSHVQPPIPSTNASAPSRPAPVTLPAPNQNSSPSTKPSNSGSCGCLVVILVILSLGVWRVASQIRDAIMPNTLKYLSVYERTSVFESPEVNDARYYNSGINGHSVDNPIVVAAVTEPTAFAALAYAIMCQEQLIGPHEPAPDYYRKVLAERNQIPEKLRSRDLTLPKTNEILARWGVSIQDFAKSTVTCNKDDVARLTYFLDAFKKAMPEIAVPKILGIETTKKRMPPPKLPNMLKDFDQLHACSEKSAAGLFMLKHTIVTGLPGKQEYLDQFAKFYVEATKKDNDRIHAYQGQAIRANFNSSKEDKTDPNLVRNCFVDYSGNIIAPLELHARIREYLRYFAEAQEMEKEQRGIYQFPPTGNNAGASQKYPELIDRIGVTVGTYILHNFYEIYSIGEKTPAALMAYCRFFEDAPAERNGGFTKLSTQVAKLRPLREYPASVRDGVKKTQDKLLMEYGITVEENGDLNVPATSFEVTKEIVASVFGDKVAGSKVKKKE